MRFGYTILYVSDVAASLDFYERALGQRHRFVHDSGQYAELDTGQTALAFAAHELAAANLPGVYRPGERGQAARDSPPGFEVCFVTDNVQRAFERAIAAGAEPVTEPQTKPWGQDVAYVRDLDGYLVELASPAGA